jgi:hypothetical protein
MMQHRQGSMQYSRSSCSSYIIGKSRSNSTICKNRIETRIKRTEARKTGELTTPTPQKKSTAPTARLTATTLLCLLTIEIDPLLVLGLTRLSLLPSGSSCRLWRDRIHRYGLGNLGEELGDVGTGLVRREYQHQTQLGCRVAPSLTFADAS